jgi:hypothetical protein
MAQESSSTYTEKDIPVPPGEVRLTRSDDGQHFAHWGEHTASVRVVRCFPWSERDRFFSIRDGEDHEIALINTLNDLFNASVQVLEQALAEAGFIFEVTRVQEVREEFEIRNWTVQTAQGARTFQTRRDEWPRRTGQGGMLVRGVAGDLYHIASEESLDPDSKRLLSVYVD